MNTELMGTRLLAIAFLGLVVTVFCGDTITKTNLPTTIISQIVTNVVEGNNQTGCESCEMIRRNPGLAFSHPMHWDAETWHEADEKWTITNVVRRVTLVSEWNGKTLAYSEETVLSSVTNRWKLEQEWKPQSQPLTPL